MIDLESRRNEGRDQRGIHDRCEVDEAHTGREPISELGADLKTETGLATAGRSDQRNQPILLNDVDQLGPGRFTTEAPGQKQWSRTRATDVHVGFLPITGSR